MMFSFMVVMAPVDTQEERATRLLMRRLSRTTPARVSFDLQSRGIPSAVSVCSLLSRTGMDGRNSQEPQSSSEEIDAGKRQSMDMLLAGHFTWDGNIIEQIPSILPAPYCVSCGNGHSLHGL
jgi:hypothetical protein